MSKLSDEIGMNAYLFSIFTDFAEALKSLNFTYWYTFFTSESLPVHVRSGVTIPLLRKLPWKPYG